MNLKYIKDRIIALGFEDQEAYTENEANIIQSINDAMSTITTEVRPIIGKYEISQTPLENVLQNPLYGQDTNHYKGTDIIYTANNAKSYYFECDGTGTATIVDDTSTQIIAMAQNKAYMAYKGFCTGNITITFGGPYSFNIKNIAVYSEKTSDSVDDIPAYRQYARYDFKELTKENNIVKFSGFSDKIAEGNFSDGYTYRSISDFQIEERKILVLNGFEKCQFTIFYKKLPNIITKETPDDTEIELDADVALLLPLLASYFIWLDDDAPKATDYYNQYEIRRDGILGRTQEAVAVVSGGVYLA